MASRNRFRILVFVLTLLTSLLFTVATTAQQTVPGHFRPNQSLFWYVQQTTLGDLDGDTDLDILLGVYYWSGQFYRNNGDGIFSPVRRISGDYNKANTVEVADLDGDDRLDMVVAGYDSLVVRINDGTGGTSRAVGFPDLPDRLYAVVPADFDGDDDIDILAAGSDGGKLFVNDGTANFIASERPRLASREEHAIAVADIDNDGDVDLSLTNRIFRNDGDGNFSDSGPLAVSRPYGQVFGDVDADGDLDLAIGDADGPAKIFLNDGGGSFVDSGQELGSSTGNMGMDLADIDLDGDLDLAVQARESFIYYNSGDGTFYLGQTLPASEGASQSSFGDLNGDGFPDFAQAAGSSGATIYIFEPTNQPPAVDAGGPYSVAEGNSIILTANGADPEGGSLDYAWDLDNDGVHETSGQSVNFHALDGPSSHPVTIKVTDRNSLSGTGEATVEVYNVAPNVDSISLPGQPVPVNGEISASASFSDPGALDTHTAEWDWGDNNTSIGTVSETGGWGSVTGHHTYGAAGVYTVRLTVTDDDGDSVESSYEYVVVYDPDGGFVTGGGWIDSPATAVTATPELVWDQDFGSGTEGWFDNDDYAGYGYITASDGVATVEGYPDDCPYWVSEPTTCYYGVFSRFDSYRNIWPGDWKAEIGVYLDPGWAAGSGFDYSVAATGRDGNHQRDYIFQVGVVEEYGPISGKALLVNASNNSDYYPNPHKLVNDNGGDYYEITAPGWYKLQHLFYDAGGYLAVDLNLLDSDGNVLWTATRGDPADTIPDEVGGNRYGFFTHVTVPDGIHVDSHKLEVPVHITGKASFGFVSKYKRGADLPEGNTQFQFQAGDLNFHSSSYEWLVVTGDDSAKFKGAGKINGESAPTEEDYKFQLWAGDAEPDTFRIRIWYEESGDEIVVYDNGMNQAIGGGSIKVHAK